MVVENNKNELIPQRIVTGWRMCIDYRKLNKATKKDHFPLPFIDEMLEWLAKHSYFCFLDGLFWLPSNTHPSRRSEQDHVHMPLWNICLPTNVVWVM